MNWFKIMIPTSLTYIFIFLSAFSTAFGRCDKFELNVIDQTKKIQTLFAGNAFYLKEYWAIKIINDSSVSNEGLMSFKGELEHPTAIRIFSLDPKVKFNELVFVEKGFQTLYLDYVEGKIRITKRPNSEVEKEYELFRQELHLENLNGKISSSGLLNYSKAHRKSYIVLFAVIDQTFQFDFSFNYKHILENVDSIIRESSGYKYYFEQYLTNKNLRSLKLINKHGKSCQLSFSKKETRPTLLEFWFEGCLPCVQKMNWLKHNQSFINQFTNIIFINVDSKEKYKSTKLFFGKQNLDWDCFWDFDLKNTKRFTNVYKFPSNLLIDSNGRLLAKDIDFAEYFKIAYDN